MKKVWVLLLMTATITGGSYAQIKLRSFLAYSYSEGFPSGDLRSFIPKKNLPGMHLEYRHFFNEKFSAGIRVGVNAFKKTFPRETMQTNIGTVSAVQTKYFLVAPFPINFHYYISSDYWLIPYIGGGLGIYYVYYEKWFGSIPFKKTSGNFGVCPEAGFLIPIKKSPVGLIVSVKYHNVFYSHNEIKNLRYFELNLALYFGYFKTKKVTLE